MAYFPKIKSKRKSLVRPSGTREAPPSNSPDLGIGMTQQKSDLIVERANPDGSVSTGGGGGLSTVLGALGKKRTGSVGHKTPYSDVEATIIESTTLTGKKLYSWSDPTYGEYEDADLKKVESFVDQVFKLKFANKD